ncbi:GAF domain-containing sensor histidine kinase [Gammaproteobacteria bacterium]|nr:GAF domain-containing sensor histidine kinase [Gammaproteobacteria bacterium]
MTLLLLLAYVIFMVLGYDFFLDVIRRISSKSGTGNSFSYFSAFLHLNKKMHNFLEIDDVLNLVNSTLKEQLKIKNCVFLINSDFCKNIEPGGESNEVNNFLSIWPESNIKPDFLTEGFEEELAKLRRVSSFSNVPENISFAFDATQTNLIIPIVQNNKILCVILIGRSDNAREYDEFEYQVFEFLADQLSIVLDRILIYKKVMIQTAIDHAEKMQIMQNLSTNIAHEMRTPLSGIRASISGVGEYLPDLLNAYRYSIEKNKDSFAVIREDHLASLQATPRRIALMIDQANTVIDMLLMNLRDNSLDKNQLNLCSAAQCVEQAVDRYPFKKGEREKVELELSEDFVFLGIESLFVYIIFNFMKNALYSLSSAQCGMVSIELKKGLECNYVIFKDTGEGIEESVLERVFDGFFTTKEDGTGVGLAYCKRTVMSFGGEIECNSVYGEYAEFKISFPIFESLN